MSERHGGMPYNEFLALLAERLRARSYLEVGTRFGASLKRITCDAICVDPNIVIRPANLAGRDRTFVFQMTSDRFFRDHDVFRYFPEGIDLAFLDGMHRFEFLLRDIANTERYCRPDTVVGVDDVFPDTATITPRNPRDRPEGEQRWAGDVWKVIPILKELRPDLRLHRVDTPPTGMLLIEGLDRDSQILPYAKGDAISRYLDVSLEDYGVDRLFDDIPLLPSEAIMDANHPWTAALPAY